MWRDSKGNGGESKNIRKKNIVENNHPHDIVYLIGFLRHGKTRMGGRVVRAESSIGSVATVTVVVVVVSLNYY